MMDGQPFVGILHTVRQLRQIGFAAQDLSDLAALFARIVGIVQSDKDASVAAQRLEQIIRYLHSAQSQRRNTPFGKRDRVGLSFNDDDIIAVAVEGMVVVRLPFADEIARRIVVLFAFESNVH